MIEILDKINNTYEKVSKLEVAIHPSNGNVTMMKDMEEEHLKITGVIYKEDGTTMILYKNNNKEHREGGGVIRKK